MATERDVWPDAGLIDLNGMLYGTTSECGGSNNNGTAFRVSRSGKERVIHKFKGQSDGADDFGTVFQMTKSGDETLLHSFTFGADGGNPSAAND